MLNFKDFEGIKRIENIKKYDLNFLLNLLEKYEYEIGKITLDDKNKKIFADVDGKYIIELYLTSSQIVIERKLEPNFEKENITLGVDLKSIDMSKADRMIEQIYDLLLSLENDSEEERITSVDKVLYAKEYEVGFSDTFYISDEKNNNLYEIKNNKLLNEFIAKDLVTSKKSIKVNYSSMELGKYTIKRDSYDNIYITKKKNTTKTTYTGNVGAKDICITADFTNNHYIVEIDKIVVGAIDSLNSKDNNSYRIEINSLRYEYLMVAITLIIDLK